MGIGADVRESLNKSEMRAAFERSGSRPTIHHFSPFLCCVLRIYLCLEPRTSNVKKSDGALSDPEEHFSLFSDVSPTKAFVPNRLLG